MPFSSGRSRHITMMKDLEDGDFWYSTSLHGVDWKKDFMEFLSHHKRDILLSISGAFSLNPLLLITSVILDDEMKLSSSETCDKEFLINLKQLAHDLATSYLEIEKSKQKRKSTIANTAVWKSLHSNDEKLQNFLEKYHELYPHSMVSTNISKSATLLDKREDDLSNSMQWPWPPQECWEVGATHGGAFEGLTEYIPSAIDMAPSLYVDWLQGFDYLGSSGSVHAAHSGKIKVHSICSLEIVSGRYSTYYAHISIGSAIQNGTNVALGDHIGNIELRPDEALCLCDWSAKSYSCSTGPHLHFEARKDNKPLSLNNVVIGGFRITAGTYERDKTCSDPEHCALAKREGSSCATRFTDRDGNIYCPSVKGSNTGNIYQSSFFSLL